MLYSLIEPKGSPKLSFALNFTRSNYKQDFPVVANNIEIVYIQSGTLYIEIGDKKITAEAGSFIVLPHIIPVKVESQKDTTHIHYTVCLKLDAKIDITSSITEQIPEGAILLPFCLKSCPDTNPLLAKMKTIMAEFHSSLTGCVYKSGCMALDLLYDIARAAEKKDDIGNRATLSHILCYRIKTYIAKNLDKKISVTDIAEALGKTPGYLSHVFREIENTSILQYINRERITKATELITINKLSLQQAAKQVGINDPNYFSRMFRRQMGVSLSEYLRNSRESTGQVFNLLD